MKRLWLMVVWLLVFTGSSRAQIFVPESGWFYNPSQSGTGMNIEFQDDYMLLSYFGYAPNGSALFYFIQGTYNINTFSMSGPVFAFSSGQCLGCIYAAPIVAQIGTADVFFPDFDEARVVFRIGQSTVALNVVRFPFNVGSTGPENNFGAWQTGIFASNGFFSDLITLTTSQTGPQGTFAIGTTRPFGRSVVGGLPISTPGEFAVLVDVSSTTDYFYSFDYGINRWLGFVWVLPKGGVPTGQGIPFHAVRIAGKNTLNQLPSAAKSSPFNDSQGELLKSVAYDPSAEPAAPEVMRRFQYLLRVREQQIQSE